MTSIPLPPDVVAALRAERVRHATMSFAERKAAHLAARRNRRTEIIRRMTAGSKHDHR